MVYGLNRLLRPLSVSVFLKLFCASAARILNCCIFDLVAFLSPSEQSYRSCDGEVTFGRTLCASNTNGPVGVAQTS